MIAAQNEDNMKFKLLKQDAELENYRHAIHPHIDVLLPLSYLKQGQVYGYFNKKGDLIGGFALINKGPFRVLDSIPDFEGLKLDPHLKHTTEVTGVWLSCEGRDKYASLKYWLTIMTKVLTSRKKYFVYAYSSKKTHLEKIYSRANPIVLFRGETKLLPGMTSVDHESVEVVIKSRIIIQALKNPDFFVKRLNFKKKKKKTFIKNPMDLKEQYEKISDIVNPLVNNISTLGGREP